MSIHIAAGEGAVARTVLLPGDPLRAKYVAETFLEEAECYSTTRNMLGYTGYRDGKRVSVQGSGMGMPSLSIYVHELIQEHGAETIIRIGTCGAMQQNLKLGDIILAQGSCSDSNMNRRRFNGMDFAPLADWTLLHSAFQKAGELSIPVRVGNILSADMFYNEHEPEEWVRWADHGVLAVEMESAELYTIAAQKRVRALSILTVSDSLITHEQMSAADRERSLGKMVEIALRIPPLMV